MNQPRSFVLNGGPQSGKSTLFRLLEEALGRQLLYYPEVASVLLGDLWPTVNREASYHPAWVRTLQRGIFHTQRGLEELAQAVAAADNIPLIGHDRGVFDNAGYLGVTGRELAKYFGESFDGLMSNYDLVIHLDTLATIDPGAFGNDTNATRYETPEEAVLLDERIWNAYEGHPHHVRIPATDDFSEKIATVFELITALCPTLAASLT